MIALAIVIGALLLCKGILTASVLIGESAFNPLRGAVASFFGFGACAVVAIGAVLLILSL